MTTYKVSIQTQENLPDGTPLVREFTICGSVTDDHGMPVPAAHVRIIEPDINDIGEGITDAEGNFKVVIKEDTMHHVYINQVHAQSVKVLASGNE